MKLWIRTTLLPLCVVFFSNWWHGGWCGRVRWWLARSVLPLCVVFCWIDDMAVRWQAWWGGWCGQVRWGLAPSGDVTVMWRPRKTHWCKKLLNGSWYKMTLRSWVQFSNLPFICFFSFFQILSNFFIHIMIILYLLMRQIYSNVATFVDRIVMNLTNLYSVLDFNIHQCTSVTKKVYTIVFLAWISISAHPWRKTVIRCRHSALRDVLWKHHIISVTD
jgi:hypothetical protein